jgi:hypothetical protein
MAKQFMSRIKLSRIKWWFITNVRRSEMMIVSLGYAHYVMPTKDAVHILEILEKAERYVNKYQANAESTHHVWPSDTVFEAKMIGNDLYNMAKLAGKPEEK